MKGFIGHRDQQEQLWQGIMDFHSYHFQDWRTLAILILYSYIGLGLSFGTTFLSGDFGLLRFSGWFWGQLLLLGGFIFLLSLLWTSAFVSWDSSRLAKVKILNFQFSLANFLRLGFFISTPNVFQFSSVKLVLFAYLFNAFVAFDQLLGLLLPVFKLGFELFE